jgi:hypothetical protein
VLDKLRPASLAMAGRGDAVNKNALAKTHLRINSHNAVSRQAASDSPPISKSGKSSVRPVSGRMPPEEFDTYPAVVVLNGSWRIIACKHGIQWILQKRRGKHWRSRYYCRTRAGLVECAHEYAGEIRGDALVILLQLPELIGGAP